jgi:hypothetical protein
MTANQINGLALGLAACQDGFLVRFNIPASLAHELIEARDERRWPHSESASGVVVSAGGEITPRPNGVGGLVRDLEGVYLEVGQQGHPGFAGETNSGAGRYIPGGTENETNSWTAFISRLKISARKRASTSKSFSTR